MSEKRRRFRKPKINSNSAASSTNCRITIARRQNDDGTKTNESEIQPKILLKPRTIEKDPKEDEIVQSTSESKSSHQNPTQRTILAARSGDPANSKVSIVKEAQQQQQDSESLPNMTRPATILSSTGVISNNAKKLLQENSDFFVVGVIGTQGVGKSTILNLLANDDCDYYQKIFVDEEGYFPTKLKQNKCPSRSRTESTHLFIKTDRMILLDCAPVMCNSYKKDMSTNELDDLRSIVHFLSVCHLVIVVYTDYLNINFVRLLRLAEVMKPSLNISNVVDDYYPNLLFIKNRAKRRDFAIAEQKRMNDMLEAFFRDSKMRIHRGQHNQNGHEHHLRSKKGEGNDSSVNSFVFPEVHGPDAVPYHKPINGFDGLVDDLRWCVFTTPRNEMSTNSGEFTEIAWFELFEKVTQTTQHFFFNTYDEIHRNHLDVVSGSNIHNANGSIHDTQDNWKE